MAQILLGLIVDLCLPNNQNPVGFVCVHGILCKIQEVEKCLDSTNELLLMMH
jgi:hypothetical protein